MKLPSYYRLNQHNHRI